MKYYNPKAYTDQVLEKSLAMKPREAFSADILILDEVQDMTPLFYGLVIKLLAESSQVIEQVLLFGDVEQTIYKFNGANPCYLQYSDQIFRVPREKFQFLGLNTSYRITTQMETFLNNVVLKSPRMKAARKGEYPVDYLITDPYENRKNYNLLALFKNYRLTFSHTEMMVLAASVRIKKSGKDNPVIHFANKLSELGVPIYVPHSDQDKVDQDLFKGKLPFLSFHQVKGLQAKVIFVFNFDNSYYLFYNKTASQSRCPNELYVATTRARERLALVHTTDMGFLPFIRSEGVLRYANVIGILRSIKQIPFNSSNRTIGVTDLVRQLPGSLLKTLEGLYQVTEKVKKSTKVIEIPVKWRGTEGLLEDVSDINGTAFGAYYQYSKTSKMNILELLISAGKLSPDTRGGLEELTFPELLKIANQYNAHTSFYTFKLNQIQNYGWLEGEGKEGSKIPKL